MSLESILLGISILLLLGVLASKASARLGIPALLLFLLIGIFAGSEGPGGVKFDYPRLTQSVGVPPHVEAVECGRRGIDLHSLCRWA